MVGQLRQFELRAMLLVNAPANAGFFDPRADALEFLFDEVEALAHYRSLQ